MVFAILFTVMLSSSTLSFATQDEKIFEINSYGSPTLINHSFERHQDSGEPTNRLHSAFSSIVLDQQKIAQETFDLLYESPLVANMDTSDLRTTQYGMAELETACTKLQNDYDAQILLYTKYPYIISDKRNTAFQEYMIDGYPLEILSEQITLCNDLYNANNINNIK